MDKEKLKIICIDDEDVILDNLSMFIRQIGYEPITISNPANAIEVIKEHEDQLIMVLCDLVMPATNGLDVRSRMIPQFQHIPFAIVSGYIDRETALKGVEYKICAFLNKPYEPDQLSQIIENETKQRIEQIEEKRFLTDTFIDESEDLLEELEPLLIELENHSDPSTINQIFRLIHTIKGSSGVLDWSEFTTFMHAYEDILSKLKDKNIFPNQAVISALLTGYDHLKRAIQTLKSNQPRVLDLETLLESIEISTPSSEAVLNAKPDNQMPATSQPSRKVDEKVQVPATILDEFMELSGEITVIRNMVNKLVHNIEREIRGNDDINLLAELLDEMHKINSSMQNKVTELRKVSIKKVLRSLPRSIRDLSQELGKEIQLEINDNDLRVDTIISQILSNSLVHIIRNSADHGIESPQTRVSSGKPKQGTIKVTSQEKNEQVVVTIEDDGAGMDPEKLRSKAVERGVITKEEAQSLSPNQCFQLIFESGFSTADQVTSVSGRGVGMDMVRSSVTSIGGHIEIDSTIGKGSTFTICLPLPKSVLIIHSLLVNISDQEFAIPQDSIFRLVQINPEKRDEYIKDIEGTKVLSLQDKIIPLIDLAHTLGLGAKDPFGAIDSDGDINVIVAQSHNFLIGLLVDQINDSEEIVVKKLAPHLEHLKVFGGATFMGDGRIGLIIDIDGLLSISNLNAADRQDYNLINSEQTNDHTNSSAGIEYLLCEAIDTNISARQSSSCYAVVLDDVFRLEQISTSDLHIVGNQVAAIYRDQTIPLIQLSELLDLNCKTPAYSDRETITTLVVSFADRYVGVIINRIVDVIYTDKSIQDEVRDREGIVGNLLLEDTVATVLDLRSLLKAKTSFLKEDSKKQQQDDSQEFNQNITNDMEKCSMTDQDQGWGLF